MQIDINGFKCHAKSSFDLGSDGVTLINGKSGEGKTTLLESIKWVLYAGMRNIYNNNKKKNVSVTLRFKDMIIYRQKNPEYLKVTIGDNVYQDQVAQCLINDRFGSKEIWNACCYVQQKERCGLLSSSNAERMEILNKIAFVDDDPRSYIVRIDQEYKNLSKLYETEKAKFSINSELFNKQRNQRMPKEIKHVSLSNLKEKLPILEQTIKDSEKKVNIYYQNKGKKQQLEKQLETVRENLFKFNTHNTKPLEEYKQECDILEKELQELPIRIHKYKQQETFKQELLELQFKLQILNDKLKNVKIINVVESDIWKAKEDEKKRLLNREKCLALGVEYEKECIKNKLVELVALYDGYLDISKKVLMYKEYKVLKSKLIDVAEDPIILEKLLVEDKEKLLHLKQGLDLQLCPHCSGALRIKGNKIVGDSGVPTLMDDIRVLEKEIFRNEKVWKSILENQKIGNELQAMEKILDIGKIEEFLDKKVDMVALKGFCEKLKNIVYLDNGEVDSSLLQCMYDKKVVEKRCVELQDLIGDGSLKVDQNVDDLKNRSRVLRKEYEEEKKKRDIFGELLKLEKEYEKGLEEIWVDEGVVEELSVLRKEYGEVVEMVEEMVYWDKLKKDYDLLTEWRQKLVEKGKELETLEKLKVKAVEVECEQLENTVEMINIVMGVILEKLFVEPITVTLRLFKELKTSKTAKMSVNIKIMFKGYEYDSVGQMSGGEGDRVSLALAVALNSVTKSPLLLLDECMTAFDVHLKEVAVSVLKEQYGKLILCVDHGATEGFYDRVVHL